MRDDIIFIDTFSGGLDDLPKRSQASMKAVLKHLKSGDGRISIFEATASDLIAETIGRIVDRGFATVEVLGYPWHRYNLSESGNAYIAA
jgi:hypothetical protein